MRWLDDVSTDLRKMGINEWRDRARDREAWRRIVKGAKGRPGLWRHRRRRYGNFGLSREKRATFQTDGVNFAQTLKSDKMLSNVRLTDVMDCPKEYLIIRRMYCKT